LWGNSLFSSDRQALIAAIDGSLRYLNTNTARVAYQNYPIAGITHERVIASLRRFRQLLLQSQTATQLQAAVAREFVFYQAIGHDNLGTVSFTGYFVPTYRASRVPTSTYPYPLYRKPAELENWPKPHPTRLQLEGQDGVGPENSPLNGYELVWLSDRLQAYVIQVQGSARLQLTDGTMMSIGYAGSTDYPYTSIGKELIEVQEE
jgi:membrane-bound lytic murein transglycosylase A